MVDYSKINPFIKRNPLKVLKTVFTIPKGGEYRQDFLPGETVELYVTESPVKNDTYALWIIVQNGIDYFFYMELESIDEFIEGASFLWQEYQESLNYNY